LRKQTFGEARASLGAVNCSDTNSLIAANRISGVEVKRKGEKVKWKINFSPGVLLSSYHNRLVGEVGKCRGKWEVNAV
jgi:hypothetical protein